MIVPPGTFACAAADRDGVDVVAVPEPLAALAMP
jgi:hypothetical protein